MLRFFEYMHDAFPLVITRLSVHSDAKITNFTQTSMRNSTFLQIRPGDADDILGMSLA